MEHAEERAKAVKVSQQNTTYAEIVDLALLFRPVWIETLMLSNPKSAKINRQVDIILNHCVSFTALVLHTG